MARSQGLLRMMHVREDRSSQSKWLANECRIRLAVVPGISKAISADQISRTSTWITLLDCAFLFFWGRIARIVSSEIKCDLPCDEDVFEEQDPFTHLRFSFRRNLTSRTALQALFDNAHSQALGATVLDTFILIHCRYYRHSE